jgi:hypothetical protein
MDCPTLTEVTSVRSLDILDCNFFIDLMLTFCDSRSYRVGAYS